MRRRVVRRELFNFVVSSGSRCVTFSYFQKKKHKKEKYNNYSEVGVKFSDDIDVNLAVPLAVMSLKIIRYPRQQLQSCPSGPVLVVALVIISNRPGLEIVWKASK